MIVRTALVVAALVTFSACGGESTGTTVDQGLDPAIEYAVSAQRALDGTRFADLGDAVVAGLVVEVCDAMGESADPDATVTGVLERPLSSAV